MTRKDLEAVAALPQDILDKITEMRREARLNPSTKCCPFCRQTYTPKRKVKNK